MRWFLMLLVLWIGTNAVAAAAQPEDSAKPHVSLCVHDDWAQRADEAALVAQFRATYSDEFFPHLYTESNPIYKTRIVDSHWSNAIPCVILQEPDGKVADQVFGAQIPTWFPRRPWLSLRPWLRPRPPVCPGPNCPEPDEPVPPSDVDVIVQPPVVEPEPASSAPLIIAATLGFILAIGAGIAIPLSQHFRGD